MAATHVQLDTLTQPANRAARRPNDTSLSAAWDWVETAILPLASLRLTVILLTLSVFVVFVATLEQTESDIWTVKNRHYSNLMLAVPIQTFLPPDWFPQWQSVPYSIVIPSGLTMLIALIINLVAAHAVRMRVQARGGRLIAGLVILAAGIAVSWLIVFGAQNPTGFQGQPPISYHVLWQAMQVGMIGLALGGLVACLAMRRQRPIERCVVGGFSVCTLAAFITTLLLGERTFIGDSGMRVLWQLLQATIAALVLLAGCILLFKRKGGIVLLHLGIGLLMVNELYVTMTNVEQQVRLLEGDTAWHTIDVRETELIVADERDPQQVRLVQVPGYLLEQGGRLTDPRLPFDIEVLQYLPNSQIERLQPGEKSLATAGLGVRFAAREIPIFTDRDQQVSFAAAYIKLWDKQSGLALGSYLVSQAAYEQKLMETVQAGGVEFRVALRFRHYYKPYSVTLVDTRRELYLGTDRPRWFSSDITITDPTAGLIDYPQRVWMNNPLRYRDETFYQTQWTIVPTEDGPKEMSVLQVVKNQGWMIPYLACMVVVVGLVTQFGSALLHYLETRAAKGSRPLLESPKHMHSSTSSAAFDSAHDHTMNIVAWVVAGLGVVLALAYLGGQWSRGTRAVLVKESLDLTAWGQLPTNFGARVQPIDSLARNTARQLSNYETVTDKFGKRQPALRWFADWIYAVPGCDEYALIRITDLSVLEALGIAPKPGFKYTVAELSEHLDTINQLTEPNLKTDRAQLTAAQKRMIDLRVQLNRLMSLRRAFTNPYRRLAEDDVLGRLEMANLLAREDHLPRLVPDSAHPEQPWRLLTHVWTERWLSEQVDTDKTRSIATLAEQIAQRQIMEPLRERMIRERVVDEILADPRIVEMIREQLATEDLREVRRRLLSRMELLPPTQFAELSALVAPGIDQLLDQRRGEFVNEVEGLIRDPLRVTGNEIPRFDNPYAQAWMDLEEAYRHQDATAFSNAVQRCQTWLGEHPAAEYRTNKIQTEWHYNAWAPLYQATVLYLMAFFLTIVGWLFWPRVWNRTATGVLLVALAVHLVAIVMRVIISGRPPVTNLYSSFVFVPAVGVAALMIVERMTRLGIANLLAAIAGAAALLWAWSMTVSDQNATGDTFTVMEAVLDTQFWLSTHVIMICLGYGGTIAAGLLGAGYLVGGILTRAVNDQRERRLAATIYGTICFALLCSFFGTVLGGLWADDSWGRFWGWDPKENGALMIVLWNAVALHARWGGMIRHRGLAALAVLGSVVTIWSWEGVNQLGQGLHSYGFSQDRLMGVGIFVAVNLALAALVFVPKRWWRSPDAASA